MFITNIQVNKIKLKLIATMKGDTFAILIFFGVSSLFLSSQARLERTKLVSGNVYVLESQHDGAYLTASGNGKVGARQANNGVGEGQRWTFTQNGDQSWTLAPVITDINIVSEQTWKVIPVSHGKSLLQSLSSSKCLINSRNEATLIDGSCDRDDPRQRWNIQKGSA